MSKSLRTTTRGWLWPCTPSSFIFPCFNMLSFAHYDAYHEKFARLLRILRFVRLVRGLTALRELVVGVFKTIQKITWVIVLVFVIVYLMSLVSVKLIGQGLFFGGRKQEQLRAGAVDRQVSAKACAEELKALADATQVRGFEASAAEDTSIRSCPFAGVHTTVDPKRFAVVPMVRLLVQKEEHSGPHQCPPDWPPTAELVRFCVSSLEGLTRTMTSNLPGQLRSCVQSVLRGTVPHAALETPPRSA